MNTGTGVVMLSGPLCAGKTTLAEALQRRVAARRLGTRELIASSCGVDPHATPRLELQRLGDSLDKRHGGAWVAAAVAAERDQMDASTVVIVDAIRTCEQRTAIAALFRALHVHLTAPEETLSERYEARRLRRPDVEPRDPGAAQIGLSDAHLASLAAASDLDIDTGVCSVADASKAVLERLRRTP